VFLLYEYELRAGERYRNTDYITVRVGKTGRDAGLVRGRYDRG